MTRRLSTTSPVFALLMVAACGTPAGSSPPADLPAEDVSAERSGSPLTIEPGAFSVVEQSEEEDSGHTRFSSPPGGGCMVSVDWWRPMPPRPGGPMTEASHRPATIDGRETRVITTSAFDGVEQTVDVAFLRGEGFQVRVLFESCGATEEDAFLAGVRVTG